MLNFLLAATRAAKPDPKRSMVPGTGTCGSGSLKWILSIKKSQEVVGTVMDSTKTKLPAAAKPICVVPPFKLGTKVKVAELPRLS